MINDNFNISHIDFSQEISFTSIPIPTSDLAQSLNIHAHTKCTRAYICYQRLNASFLNSFCNYQQLYTFHIFHGTSRQEFDSFCWPTYLLLLLARQPLITYTYQRRSLLICISLTSIGLALSAHKGKHLRAYQIQETLADGMQLGTQTA